MIERFDVSVGDVLANLPIDGSAISATSQPLNTDTINQFIDRGASVVLNQLGAAGVPLSEDAATEQQCRAAIIAYAVMESMGRMGMLGTQAYRDAKEQWETFKNSMQSSLNINAKSSTRTLSTSTGKTGLSQFSGRNYRDF